MSNRFDGGCKEWENQQAFRIEDIALDTLVDEWDRLVHDEPPYDDGDQQDVGSQLYEEHGLVDEAPLNDEQQLNDYDMPLDDDGLRTTTIISPHSIDSHTTTAPGTQLLFTDLLASSEPLEAAPSTSQSTPHNIWEPSGLGKAYMQSLNMQSGLHVAAAAKVKKAYNDNAEMALAARAILAFTDGEVHTTGTVRLNLIDKWNKPAVEVSVQRVSEAERGQWELVAAVEPLPAWKKEDVQHQKAQKGLPKSRKTQFQPTLQVAD
ncbi:hypothetical protein PHMEG_00014138, partial [Phytophthora megakarya]